MNVLQFGLTILTSNSPTECGRSKENVLITEKTEDSGISTTEDNNKIKNLVSINSNELRIVSNAILLDKN